MKVEHQVEGVLKHVDLGMGAWVLELADGGRLTLDFAPGLSPRAHEGRRVRLSGAAPEAAPSLMMTGDRIMAVRAISPR